MQGETSRRYRVQCVLGHGGMGIVFRAFDRLRGHDVALKTMAVDTSPSRSSGRTTTVSPPRYSMTETLSATRSELWPAGVTSERAASLASAIASEFRLLASLRHPDVIRVLDYGQDDQAVPYFTMELLKGPLPLDVACRGEPVSTRIRLLRDVAQALVYLHRRGVVHRDLKPTNLLVVSDRGRPRVKVLDFGLATSRACAGPRTGFGTPPYMAPELLAGAPATPASDLFAFGAVTYELFAGRPPFPPPSPATFTAMPPDGPPDLRAMDAPPALRALVGELLANDAKDRPANAAVVVERLSGLCRGMRRAVAPTLWSSAWPSALPCDRAA